MKTKYAFFTILLMAALLAACGTQTENTGTSGNLETPAANTSQNDAASSNTGDAAMVETPAGDTTEVSFANDVLPILESRCLTCHGGDRIEGGLVVSSYADLMAGGKDGAVVIPGDAAGSLLYDLTASGKMPKRGANLTPVQLAVIEAWINAGALDN
jgi:mono/diheme cytochrome c family protein